MLIEKKLLHHIGTIFQQTQKFQSTSIFFTKFKKFLKKLIGIKIQIYRYKKLNAKNESLTSYQKNISIIN